MAFIADWKCFLVITFLINENNGGLLLLSVSLLLLCGPYLPAASSEECLSDFVPSPYRRPS